jgi:glucose/arabinose dehydrogenase
MSRRPLLPPLALGLAGILGSACSDAARPLAPADVAGPALSQAPASAITLDGAPVFALATLPNGSLVAGQVPVGIVELGKKGTSLRVALPNVSGIAANGTGNLLAITGAGPAPTDGKLWRITGNRAPQLIADLAAFEAANNPDGGHIDSNPFGMASLGGNQAIVADAAANTILRVDHTGRIEVVAVLPSQLLPFPPAGGSIPAESVPTSVAVGPDGTIYVGELTGFPGTPGASRIWRIAAGATNVACPSAACSVLSTGLTSIMDLAVSPDGGTVYAVELDAGGWLALEGGPPAPPQGGRVRACSTATGACTTLESGVPFPTAITIGKDGRPWIAVNPGLFGGPSIIRPVQ